MTLWIRSRLTLLMGFNYEENYFWGVTIVFQSKRISRKNLIKSELDKGSKFILHALI